MPTPPTISAPDSRTIREATRPVAGVAVGVAVVGGTTTLPGGALGDCPIPCDGRDGVPSPSAGDASSVAGGTATLPGGALGDRLLPGNGRDGVPSPSAAGAGVGDAVGGGTPTLPVRKRLDHRGPLSIDISGAWYFITICAEGQIAWQGWRKANADGSGEESGHAGRVTVPGWSAIESVKSAAGTRDACPYQEVAGVVRSRVSRDHVPMSFDEIANAVLSAARWYHEHGKWKLALFLVMPDHLHFIAHFRDGAGGHAGRVTVPNNEEEPFGTASAGGHAGRVTVPARRISAGRCESIPMVAKIQHFKSYLARTYGIKCKRDFFDTRLRDDAHYGEKFRYICNNPVRKGLCATAREWLYIIAFDRETGAERGHR